MARQHFPTGPISSLLLGVAGGALLSARSRRSTQGRFATLAGLALVGVAAQRPVAEMLRRAGANRRSAHLRMSFVVPRPVAEVFRFCSDFANYPRFVGALQDVEDFGDGRSHWTASTPVGGTIEWDAITTKFVTNRVIEWRSTPSSRIRLCGMLRFVPEPTGGTCLKVTLDYAVPNGTMIDAVASLSIPRRIRHIENDIKRLAERADLFIDSPTPPDADVVETPTLPAADATETPTPPASDVFETPTPPAAQS